MSLSTPLTPLDPSAAPFDIRHVETAWVRGFRLLESERQFRAILIPPVLSGVLCVAYALRCEVPDLGWRVSQKRGYGAATTQFF